MDTKERTASLTDANTHTADTASTVPSTTGSPAIAAGQTSTTATDPNSASATQAEAFRSESYVPDISRTDRLRSDSYVRDVRDVSYGPEGNRASWRESMAPPDNFGERGTTFLNGRTLAAGLGAVGLGLGLAQLLAPRQVAAFIGLEDDPNTTNWMRACGMREITTGVGLLMQPDQPAWMWARAAGDGLDVALLTSAAQSKYSDTRRIGAALGAVALISLADLFALDAVNRQASAEDSNQHAPRGRRVEKAITVNRTPEDCYRYWRQLENLPRFMNHLDSVQQYDEFTSHWVAKAPMGMRVEWDAEIVSDRPGELIAWRSLPGADVFNGGTVRFEAAPANRGTTMHVTMHYAPPGGMLGSLFAQIFGEEPSQQVDEDLRRYRQVMELGDVTVSDASARADLGWRSGYAAQPPAQRYRTAPCLQILP